MRCGRFREARLGDQKASLGAQMGAKIEICDEMLIGTSAHLETTITLQHEPFAQRMDPKTFRLQRARPPQTSIAHGGFISEVH